MNRTWATLVTVALSLLVPNRGISEEAAFDPRAAIRTAVVQFETRHFAHTPLDNALARKWLPAFIERLDPRRMYFLDSDLREFRQFEDRLDDLAKEGDFQFPRLVRERFQKRTEQASLLAAEFLAEKHDYTVDEEIPILFDGNAAKPEELRKRWRLRIKGELLIEKVHSRPLEEVKSQLSGRYERIARQARVMSDERLCQTYVDSLATLYDPHSGYLSPTYLTRFKQNTSFRNYSLGLSLQQRAGQYVITSVLPFFRSRQARSPVEGWSLIAIRRLDGPPLDLVEMHPDDLGSILGRFGALASDTEVILELMHPKSFERVTMSWNRISLD